MAGLQPFNLGNVLAQGENILNARAQRDPNSLKNQLLAAKLQNELAPGSDPTSNMRDLEHLRHMIANNYPADQIELMKDAISKRWYGDIGNVPHWARGGTAQPIGGATLAGEAQGEAAVKGAGAYASEHQKMRAQAGYGAPVVPSELNLGVQQAQPSQVQPTAAQTAPPTPEKPVTAASLAADKAEQVALAKETAAVNAEYTRMKSNMPGLIKNVAKLKVLSEKATYTLAGKARDTTVRELGMGATEGAVARADMIATVDNQVLPLLRETFGAAFTKAEGDTLRAALVNPDSSHEERMAQLDAFIEQKVASLEAKRIQLGGKPASEEPEIDIQSMSDEELDAYELQLMGQ